MSKVYSVAYTFYFLVEAENKKDADLMAEVLSHKGWSNRTETTYTVTEGGTIPGICGASRVLSRDKNYKLFYEFNKES